MASTRSTCGPAGPAVLGQAERLAQSRQRGRGWPDQIWRACSMASTRPTRAWPSGAAPSTCRPSRIWASLTSHSQPSTCRTKSSNSASCGPGVQAEVVVEPGGLDQRPDLRPDGGQLGRVERRDAGVLVQQLLQPGQVAVGLGPGHRRHQVADDGGVRAPLGLRALAGVVDQERVDQRQVAQRRVGARTRPTCRGSCPAATPACRACPGGPRRARRSRAPATGRRPGSGGSAAAPGRGRSRSGSPRTRAAAGPAARRCPPVSAASTISPSGSRDRSTYSSPGGGPQALLHSLPQRRGQLGEPLPVLARPGSGPRARTAAGRSASPGPGRRPR